MRRVELIVFHRAGGCLPNVPKALRCTGRPSRLGALPGRQPHQMGQHTPGGALVRGRPRPANIVAATAARPHAARTPPARPQQRACNVRTCSQRSCKVGSHASGQPTHPARPSLA